MRITDANFDCRQWGLQRTSDIYNNESPDIINLSLGLFL